MSKHAFRTIIPCTTLLFLLLFISPANQASATPAHSDTVATGGASNVRFAGQVGGGSDAIYVVGNRAYVGEGPAVTILDVSDPTKPKVLGKTPPMDGFVNGVMVVGNRAYQVDSFGGLSIVDVSDPANTRQVGFVDTVGSANDVYVLGNLVLMANYSDGLRVVDITNPITPSEVGFYDTPGLAYGVEAVGDFAYIADGSSGLRVISIANPNNPTEVGFYDTPDDARGLTVVNNIAYVADGDSGLQMINVATPSNPTFLGAQDTPFYGLGVAVVGNRAYVADGGDGLRVIDVSNPNTPNELGFLKWDEYAYNVFAIGTIAYVAHSGPGMRIVDASQPATPTEKGYYHRPAGPLGVFVQGNLAYLADGSSGLRIADLSNLGRAYEVGYVDTPYHADDVYVSGATAYVADLAGGLRIINVANPAAPVEVGAYDPAASVHGVYVTGGKAYITEDQGLRILNVSNPASPQALGFFNTPGIAERVQVIGNTAYVAAGGSGLRIVNVANPASPSQLGFYDTPNYANDLYVADNLAYVADYDTGLVILDVSNPASPQLRGTLDTQGSALNVYVANKIAYVADYTNDVRVINVTNPASPQEVGFYEMPGNAWGVFAIDNTFYVANNPGGLFVLRYPACYKLTVAYTGDGALPATNPTRSNGCDPGNYIPGEVVTLSANPASNWRVRDWLGTDNDQTESKVNKVSMPAIDHEVLVNYTPICYTLTLGHSGTGNDPTAMPTNSPNCALGQYVAGATITLNSMPGAGYTVGSWSGTTNNSSTTSTNTVTMPGANHNAGVVYTLACYNLTLNHTGNGSDPIAAPTQSGGCTAGAYHFNEVVSLSATPEQGWQVAGWSGADNNSSTAATNSLTMPADAHTAAVNYSEIPTVGPGDSYEVDNSCTRHRPIAADGSETQEHTFHAVGDVDWVRFTANAGVKYRIDVQVPEDSPADINMEIYAQCEDAPVDEWHESFSPGARLDVQAPASGQVFVRLSNQEATVAGDNVRYQLSVRALDGSTGNRALILVAGRLKGADNLQKNIHNVTNAVYTLFQGNGYTDDNIYYLATDANLPGYDAALTKESLRIAITQWAKSKVSNNGVLTLYMMDHGSPDIFYLDDLHGERLTPDDLNGWLSEFEAAAPNAKVNVFIEACQSGSFIVAPGSISKPGRIVITSSNAVNDAKASKDGAYFSDHLLTWLHQGYNLFVAFNEASEVAATIYTQQQAMLDANGNGVPNELADGAAAAQRSFAYAGTLGSDEWPPHIFAVQVPSTVSNFKGVIEADVRDNVKVRQVWAVVYPPDYTPPPTTEELQAEVLPTFLLTPVDNGSRFAGEYTGFTQPGTYRIIVQAEDSEGLQARPVVTEVKTGAEIFLPYVVQ